MKKREYRGFGEIKMSRFPPSLFATYLVVLSLMSAVHVGLIILANRQQWSDWLHFVVPAIYWGIVAVGLTVFTRQKMTATYEKPLQQLAKATQKVANGDFSVYIPKLHTSDKMDYLDVMILDFNKMVEELGSIETLKTDFVSNVSHEIKTPIAIIKNYAELLQMDNITEEQRKEYAASIESTAVKLSNLVTNILKLNKLENQKITPEKEEYDVCRQLCECAIGFEDAWEEKQIELETDIEECAMVKADANLLELVWNNLLSNAIKFTEPGGTITIRQSRTKNAIQVSVSDTGCGMSDESIKHIFDKFYQGDTSHSKEGNGLGLPMVKRIIELSDGEIYVSSKEGKGSTFTVILPASDAIVGENGGK